VLLSGCASMGNTLAQDLAWERWEKCRVSGVNVSRIEPSGRTWVTYTADHGGALREWQECDRKAATEQGRQRSASIPAPASAVVALPSAPIPAPIWQVGSEWAYRYETPDSAGTFVWVLDRTESVGAHPHYVIKAGSREIFYRAPDLAFTQETVDGKTVRQVTPSDWRWVAFPLAVGKSWDMQYEEARPPARQMEDVRRTCTAETDETVTVPAGTFATVRVSCKNQRNGAWLVTVWYSPQVMHLVREESAVTGGKRVRELISYRLR
jgi:hypothetical protein